MDRNHQRARGHRVRGAQIQTVARVPQFVSLRAARGEVRDSVLSPQRGHVRSHMPRYIERQVDGPLRRAHRVAVHTEPAGRAQHAEPPQPAGLLPMAQPTRLQEIFR